MGTARPRLISFYMMLLYQEGPKAEQELATPMDDYITLNLKQRFMIGTPNVFSVYQEHAVKSTFSKKKKKKKSVKKHPNV